MNWKQKGMFKIDRRIIQGNPQQVSEIFAAIKCVPVRAECLAMSDEVEYYAISSKFDVLKEGERVPKYNIEVSINSVGFVERVTVRREDSTND